jgi:nucleotide-binding universal stress UspA family protein
MPQVSFEQEQKAVAAMDALVPLATRVSEDLRMTTEITTGSSAEEILNRARETNVELIVIGTKGLTLFEEGVYGGTAKRVFSDSPCSVLAVREDREPA